VRRYCAGIPKRRTSLVIKKVDTETGIDRGLIGIRRGTPNLVQAEAAEQGGLIGEAMIDSRRKLVRICRDF